MNGRTILYQNTRLLRPRSQYEGTILHILSKPSSTLIYNNFRPVAQFPPRTRAKGSGLAQGTSLVSENQEPGALVPN